MKYQATTAKARQLMLLQRIASQFVPNFFVVPMKDSDESVLEKICQQFPEPTALIFRTSAEGEDDTNRSAAGLYESVPDISSINTKAIKNALSICRNSVKLDRVTKYFGKEITANRSEIIVQAYIEPEISGVAFVYPEDQSNSLVSFGGKESVTSGNAVLGTLSFEKFLESNLVTAERGVRTRLITELITVTAQLATPSDLEWLIADNSVYLVQARPITSNLSGTTFGEIVFDSTNIGENYPGITAPLTYSFVRSVYSSVYPHFLKLLGTSDSVLAQNTFATSNLVAYVDGRIYYNLENWYRLLKLLPFYRYLKTYFNRMLSPVKSVDTVDASLAQVSLKTNILFSCYMLLPVLRTHQFETAFPKLFYRFEQEKWKRLPTPAIFMRFEALRDSFLQIWSNTIINDFHVMVFWGLLVALSQKTFDKPALFLNSAVDSSHFPASLEPMQALKKLALLVKQNPTYSKLFLGDPHRVLRRIRKLSLTDTLRIQFEEYLLKYGNRSGQELKIEIPKFVEQPDEVVCLMQQYIRSGMNDSKPTKRHPPKHLSVRNRVLLPLVKIVQHIAVEGIYRREKYRMMRGEAFGIARSVFLEIGARLKNQGLLRKIDDVFLLTYEELSSLILYHTLPIDPSKIVQLRKKQLRICRDKKLGTRVLAYGWNSIGNTTVDDDLQASSTLCGKGTSITPPLTGEVYILEEFSVDAPIAGKILVTKKTDPGWTVLFPLIKGIVTETGSTLSHASIIARELGIPCITGVQNCTTMLKNGDSVILIPETGEVRCKNI